MCTLTAIKLQNKIIVTMNRDENRTRDEANYLENVQSVHGARIVFPIDLLSNGSWFGANDFGVVLGLLNRYQNPLKKKLFSRGKIIPKALSLGGSEEIYAFLTSLKIKNYNPFDLILISNTDCYRFKWDGANYTIHPLTLERYFFITSSSVDMDQVLEKRETKFSQWHSQTKQEKMTENSILREFHLKQESNKSHSVNMAREHSHTKSICQAVISKSASHLHYLPLSELEKIAKQASVKYTKQTVILPFQTCQKKITV